MRHAMAHDQAVKVLELIWLNLQTHITVPTHRVWLEAIIDSDAY
jgi:hypothetical protein